MASVVSTVGVDLSNPAGISGVVPILDTAGNTKDAPAVVIVDSTGTPIGFATQATAAAILAALQGTVQVTVGNFPTSQTVALSTAQITALQVADLNDGLGNPINSLAAGSGQNGLIVATGATNYVASVANSSSSQLAIGQTFVGTIENAFNEPSASVLLTCDQPGTLTINQYITGLVGSECVTTSFNIAANAGFGRSFVLNGNDVNFTFQNTGNATTTTFNLNVAYGQIPSATQLLNAPSAINEIGGVAVSGSLPVTLSQTVPVSGSVAITSLPAGSGLSVTEANLTNAQSNDQPVFTVITGDPSGDFAGVNILEKLVDTMGDLALNARVVNPQKVDAQNALVLSDAPASINLIGPVGSVFLIDTTGYQSINITTQAAAGTVTASDDLITFSALSGAPRVLGALTSSIAATAGYSFPVVARWMKIVLTTAGSATAYLRATPWVGAYQSSPSNNVAQLAGTAPVTAGVAGTLAVGGNVAAGLAPTANPIVGAGVDSGGLTRRVLTDVTGRLQVASVALNSIGNQSQIGVTSTSPFGVPATIVQDMSVQDGKTFLEILAQILLELQIGNQQRFEMMSGASLPDDPSVYRTDSTLFN